MNIKDIFIEALATTPKHPADYKPEDFTGTIHDVTTGSSVPLFSLLSAGSTEAVFPFSFDIRSLDCFLFLYTKEGCGKLVIGNQVYSLTPSSLLLLDCRERFRIDIAIEPWNYEIFFVTGNAISSYYDLLPDPGPIVSSVAPFSQAVLCLEKLLFLTDNNSLSANLVISSLIDSLLTDLIAGGLLTEQKEPQIASYLTDLKSLFDNAFDKTYSLDELAERFHISKYRLCREFGNAFGMPPLKYLNRKRIEIAQHLLLTTDLKIHEVGSRVGIDNTNHFISLFRQINGTTPLEYKQRMTF